MKRTKAFFLTILAVMGLCSCGESSEVKPVKLAEDYKTPAEFTIDGTEYVASFTRGGADMWQCEITAPETVSGMVITCSGESARLEYKGLTYETDRGNIPESSAVTMTAAVLDKLISQKGVTYLKNDKGDITATGQIKGQDFSAKIKGEKVKIRGGKRKIHIKKGAEKICTFLMYGNELFTKVCASDNVTVLVLKSEVSNVEISLVWNAPSHK